MKNVEEHPVSGEGPRVEELLCRAAERQRAQVERRAYEIFLNRGGTHGYDMDDWLQARRLQLDWKLDRTV